MNPMPRCRSARATALAATALLLGACATVPAEAPPAQSAATACPDVTRLRAPQLHGRWALLLPALGQRGQLTLRRHPEFSDSLRGEIDWGHGVTAIASGDVEGGEFNLDESRDGKSLAAFWSGQLTPAACGNEIRGIWQPLPGRTGAQAHDTPFVLRRIPHAPGHAPAAPAPQASAPAPAAPPPAARPVHRGW